MDWTPEQTQAITAQGRTLLVSAAAGSGKTAVLVERVLRKICDQSTPCAVTDLLIVTFTRAAAANMREKMQQAIASRLAQDPENKHLLQQQRLLPLAKICTIDKFCLSFVQTHAATLQLPPTLRMLDESERTLVQNEALDETLAAAYATEDPAFLQLGLLLELGGDDKRLRKMLVHAANMALATPNPTAFLQRLAASYQAESSPQGTHWGQLVQSHIALQLAGVREFLCAARALLPQDPALAAAYDPTFCADIAQIDALLQLASASWDTLRSALQHLQFARLKNKPKTADATLAEQCKALRNRAKEACKTLCKHLCVSQEEFQADGLALHPLAACFVALVSHYMAGCSAKKKQRNGAEFSDYLHWALSLLRNEQGDPTPLAQAEAQRYHEILIDEYQDINEAQGQLFNALSQNQNNLFLVGDVKQSIYRFRQAKPSLFLQKRNAWPLYPAGSGSACVLLAQNFRSHAAVTDATNFVFRQLMRANAAEIEYTQEEELRCGRTDAAAHGAVELHLLQALDGETTAQTEARAIATRIADAVASGAFQPRDFCILLRSDKKTGATYAAALQAQGIDALADRSESLFSNREVQLLLALLRVVDNPLQDIALTAILLSPVGGFSPDLLTQLRLACPKSTSIFHLLTQMQSQSEPCRQFLEQLSAWRCRASITNVGDFLRWLLEETALLAIVGAMPRAAQRRANLLKLENYALSYGDQTAGLAGFLRFIDRIESNETLVAANTTSETANVVRIMSIHKSKGLEFPVCILAQCAHEFNLRDSQEPLILHETAGLALQRPDPKTRTRLPTLPHIALQIATHHSCLAEELRLLYVAMTRARDILWIYTTERDPHKKLASLVPYIPKNQTQLSASAILAAQSFSDWLLCAALRHPDANEFRHAAEAESSELLPSAEPWHFAIHYPTASTAPPASPSPALAQAVDPTLATTLHERMDWRYRYEPLRAVAAKRAVSELTESAQQATFAFTARPAFCLAQSISSAQRGVAMHAFLQYANFKAAAHDLNSEITRLEQAGYLTKRDTTALERDKLQHFFASQFAQRMLQAPKLLREQKFALRVPAADYADLPPHCQEEIVVQGIIDCAFEENGSLVLLDYKTDRVDSFAVLLDRYAEQLRLYRRAMQVCFGATVRETLLYSFWLGDWVQID